MSVLGPSPSPLAGSAHPISVSRLPPTGLSQSCSPRRFRVPSAFAVRRSGLSTVLSPRPYSFASPLP
jgi:hypothetical protein